MTTATSLTRLATAMRNATPPGAWRERCLVNGTRLLYHRHDGIERVAVASLAPLSLRYEDAEALARAFGAPPDVEGSHTTRIRQSFDGSIQTLHILSFQWTTLP